VLEYERRYCLAAVVSERETSEAATAALDKALQEAKRLGLGLPNRAGVSGLRAITARPLPPPFAFS
jgi:hypothetical protein